MGGDHALAAPHLSPHNPQEENHMSIKLKAYCDNPTCPASTTLIQGDQVVAPRWIIANIADIDGEWYDDSPVHAMHFCGHECYAGYVDNTHDPNQSVMWQDMLNDFAVDESLLQDRAS